jgi:hypothetical protein
VNVIKRLSFLSGQGTTINKFVNMGRPPTRAKEYRDGFYIEVRNKGSLTGIKIIRKSRDEMMQAIKEYEKTKEVVILGESKNGKWTNKPETYQKFDSVEHNI